MLVLVVLAALAALFVLPLGSEGRTLATQMPALIEQTRQGKGPIGDLLQRTKAVEFVPGHQAQIRSFAAGLSTPAAGVLHSVATGVADLVTILCSPIAWC